MSTKKYKREKIVLHCGSSRPEGEPKRFPFDTALSAPGKGSGTNVLVHAERFHRGFLQTGQFQPSARKSCTRPVRALRAARRTPCRSHAPKAWSRLQR